MRTSNLVLALVCASGCALTGTRSHGVTRGELAGTASVVFTNATPDPMCNMQIQRNGERSFGDNWLPSELPSGKSVDLKVKPGIYMATWNTCKRADHPYHAGTLVGQNAFTVKDGKDAIQLFAYVADTVAPTKRAAPRDFHTMVKFPGQVIGGAASTDEIATVDSTAQPQGVSSHSSTTAQVATKPGDMKAFIDPSAAKTKRKTPIKPSLDRKHDLGDRKVGFAERKR